MASPSPCCSREAEPVQRLVDVLDQPDGVGGLVLAVLEPEFPGLDQDPGEPPAQTGGPEPRGVLDGPHARFDPYANTRQDLHELGRAGLGEVDGGVVRLAPGLHELEAALGVGLDLGAGRHAHGHAAGITDPRDHLVNHPRVKRLVSVGVARVGSSPLTWCIWGDPSLRLGQAAMACRVCSAVTSSVVVPSALSRSARPFWPAPQLELGQTNACRPSSVEFY